VAGKEGAAKTEKEAMEREEKGRMGTLVGWGGSSKQGEGRVITTPTAGWPTTTTWATPKTECCAHRVDTQADTKDTYAQDGTVRRQTKPLLILSELLQTCQES